jgi:hypothetical protein
LLCLDELGYLPCDARSGDLLYSIISRRHERASTVISTNLAFKDWGSVFPGAACVVALVDRFTQHCHVVDIDGDSWRQRPEPSPEASPSRLRRATPLRLVCGDDGAGSLMPAAALGRVGQQGEEGFARSAEPDAAKEVDDVAAHRVLLRRSYCPRSWGMT